MKIESRETPHSQQNRPEPNSLLTQFAASMKKKGLKEIGSGAMALVFQSENSGEVIKVFRRDSCFIAFLKIIAENKQNKHLPIIYQYDALKVPPYAGLHIVKMEKLTKVAEDPLYENACYALYNVLRELQHDQQATSQSAQTAVLKAKQEVSLLKPENQDLYQTVELLSKIPLGCEADLHNHNIMRRKNGTLVVIDPYV